MSGNDDSILKRFFYSRFFVVSVTLLITFFVLGYFDAMTRATDVEQEIALLEEELASRKKKQLESLDFLKYVKSDRFVEEKARMELNLRKPNENTIVLHGNESHSFPQEGLDPVQSTGHKLANPIKWWYYFTKKSIDII